MKTHIIFVKIPIRKIVSLLAAFLLVNSALADCHDCWKPSLNFDIEKQGFMGSMIFISGQSYALSASNKELSEQGKDGFFCKKGEVGSKEIIEILNGKLSGVVTSEEVTRQIVAGLKERYPCTERRNPAKKSES